MIEDIFIPDGFKAMMKDTFGASKAETLLSALADEPEISLRINRRKLPSAPLYKGMTEVPWCPSGYYLDQRPIFTLNPLLHAGVFYVQDASSMVYELITAEISNGRPMVAADLCAAPGGKTTAMLNALADGSVMLANEASPARANILKENLSKYGYADVIVTNCDATRLAAMRRKFDLVAVDAPCSGEGMMRKEETARTQWSEGLVRQCAGLQRDITEAAVEMLAPGGYLIYSTCTFNTTEDEDNARMLAEDYGLIPVDTGLAGRFGIQPHAKGEIPCLRFMPGMTKGEGLFVAVFRRPGERAANGEPGTGMKRKKTGKGKTDLNIPENVRKWIEGNPEIINHDGHLIALSATTGALLKAIPKGVRVISAGVELGEIKGKDVIPAHQLAMSTAMTGPFPEVELSREDALLFLTKDSVRLPERTPRGYVTVTYQGYPLGFMKNLGNRANNLYPAEYRIRDKSLIKKES